MAKRPLEDLLTPLNRTDHYQALRKALWKVRPQWRNIGLVLGIPLFKLNEFSGSFEDQMDQMLEMWLDHTLPTPTWGALVDALRDDTVEGGKPVAAEIEANYIGGEQSVVVSPSLHDLLRDVTPEKLDQSCRDDHLCAIALSVTEWKSHRLHSWDSRKPRRRTLRRIVQRMRHRRLVCFGSGGKSWAERQPTGHL